MKSEILAIFQIRKNTKNPEISEIAISPQSHNPTIPQSPSFSPRRPSRESGRRPLDSENSWRNQRGWRQERLYHGGRRDSSTAAGETLPSGKQDSVTITAAGEALFTITAAQARLCHDHGGTRETLSRRQERLYHNRTRHSITATR